jgi:hypothetical protein
LDGSDDVYRGVVTTITHRVSKLNQSESDADDNRQCSDNFYYGRKTRLARSNASM